MTVTPYLRHLSVAWIVICLGSIVCLSGQAQDGVVDFERDIKPIFERRCFDCHGDHLAEADFNLNDPDILADYLVAGSATDSDVYDVLVNEDRLMPPEDEGGPLPAAEIALIRLWIDEGAAWPEGVKLGAETASADPVEEPAPKEPARKPPSERSVVEKLWSVHGYFHPAIVHFPVAMLTFAAIFILLHWILKGNYREFAFYLLMIGALTSIVACTMGWAFAPERSMGGGIFDFNHKVFNHRWAGIGLAVLSSTLTLIALRARKSDSKLAQFVWQAGILVAAGLVGIVGHQGGELVYGEGMYERAIEKYFGAAALESLGLGHDDTSSEAGGESGEATTGEQSEANDAGSESSSEAEDTTPEANGEQDAAADTTSEGESSTTFDGVNEQETESETAPAVQAPPTSSGDNDTDGESTDGGSNSSDSAESSGTGSEGSDGGNGN